MEHIHDKSVSFNLNFVAPDIILQAVLHVDTALIASRPDINIDDCQCLFYSFDTHTTNRYLNAFCLSIAGDRSSSPFPDFVPNTHPEELSYPPPTEPETGRPSKNLKRRATPSAVSRPSSPPLESMSKGDEEPPPRKVCSFFCLYIYLVSDCRILYPTLQLLKRRAKAPPSIIGIDDPSVIESAPDAAAAEVLIAAASSVRPSTFADPTVRHTPQLTRFIQQNLCLMSPDTNSRAFFAT